MRAVGWRSLPAVAKAPALRGSTPRCSAWASNSLNRAMGSLLMRFPRLSTKSFALRDEREAILISSLGRSGCNVRRTSVSHHGAGTARRLCSRDWIRNIHRGGGKGQLIRRWFQPFKTFKIGKSDTSPCTLGLLVNTNLSGRFEFQLPSFAAEATASVEEARRVRFGLRRPKSATADAG